MLNQYNDVITELESRLFACMQSNPQASKLQDVWDLFTVEGLSMEDLPGGGAPSLAQVSSAYIRARERYKEQQALELLR